MIELIEKAAKLLRGVCMDPRIPQDTKQALWSRVRELDAAVVAATELKKCHACGRLRRADIMRLVRSRWRCTHCIEAAKAGKAGKAGEAPRGEANRLDTLASMEMTMGKNVVVIALTPEQQAAVASVMDEAREAGESGVPGMVVAQVFTAKMRVGFLPHDRAAPIARRLNGQLEKVRSAHEC